MKNKLYFTDVDIFKQCFDCLKETSKDASDKKHVNYMTNSEIETINFDKVKDCYISKYGFVNFGYCSIDALLVYKSTPNKAAFIEFKNGDISKTRALNEVKNSVCKKIRDSVLILLHLLGKDIKFVVENIDFILVYNDNHQTSIGNHITSLAKESPFTRFKFGNFERVYFRKVYTLSKEQFEEYLAKNF